MGISLLTTFAVECRERPFLGLKPWFHYINDRYDEATNQGHFIGCNVEKFKLFPPHSDVPLVLLAIVDDLLRIAGLVAVAFVIVGAIQLMTSEGDPEGAGNAQSTIINALIGLAIAIVAVAFVSFIGSRLD